jgi:phospholipid/cholesterol/gamma-HCH transport system substrate-binding protein
MKISNETRVGILTIVALALLIIGFNFLKGKDVFNKQKQLYAVFADLGGLKVSNEVKINGLPIGAVYGYKEIDKDLSGIIVVINLKRDVNIPDDSKATIESELLGTTYINILKGTSKEYLEDKDTVNTDIRSSIFSSIQGQINPTLGKMREAIDSLKLVLGGVSNLFEKDSKGNIQSIILNLKDATGSLKTLLDAEKGSLAKTLNNASSISENLKKNNDSITATISGIRRTAEKFSTLEIQPTIDSLQGAIGALRTMLAKVSSNNGSLGLLMNDRKLYDKLNEVLLSAEILFDDLRTHPKRYTGNFIFNRKDKTGPLTSPSKKDSVPQSAKQ